MVCISAAKVPIVKIWDPELGLACDMNVNNTVALENTRMVRTYVETDPRIRKLAMIIKYWTRKRIINDAGKIQPLPVSRTYSILTPFSLAFGGTLSSYTWICLIIAFLQLRSPPVLPALHQLPYKMPRPDGSVGEFADNMKKLKGFGNKNKSSDADLLFQFFRFYAHEFDYDKHVLSVRQGKLITKTDKKWNYAINNQLCVEEPFNVSRNLGNTVDEYSFRGVHLEIRRAFDLVSNAKLDEACEQFVFPKEEERVWSRPPQQPRPAMIRSSSQTHTGRGGRGNHRGGRHNNNYHRGGGGGGGSNRRASSSVPTYDPAMFMSGLAVPQDVSWYPTSQLPFQYSQQDLMAQMAYQENMRQLHLYAQSPAFLQHQQNLAHQRLSASSSSSQQSPSDRSRTNSIDNAPASALLRPELYAMYGMSLGHQFYAQGQNGYGTYPSSPATTTGAGQEFRRPLQRSAGASDAGGQNAGSSLRSQSQPATRSPSSAPFPSAYQQAPASTSYFTTRNANGVAIPNFMPDDGDFDETPKATSESPVSEDPRSGGGFFAAHSSSPTKSSQMHQSLAGGIAFGDIASPSTSQGSIRSPTEQLPQGVHGKKSKRGSRSPSPLGHGRAFSVGTASAPLPSAQFSANPNNLGRPLVVNGSGIKSNKPRDSQSTAASTTSTGSSPVDGLITDMNNALRIQAAPLGTSNPTDNSGIAAPEGFQPMTSPYLNGPPIIVNGPNMASGLPTGEDASFRERIAMMNSYYAPGMNQGAVSGKTPASAQQRLLNRHPQSGLIAPLDLAINDNVHRATGIESAHLSPVYETRTPSPTTHRKTDAPTTSPAKNAAAKIDGKGSRADGGKVSSTNGKASIASDGSKGAKTNKTNNPGQATRANMPRENGHVRSAKSESDTGWQKAGKNKKKATNASAQQGQSEQPPKHEAERKGG